MPDESVRHRPRRWNRAQVRKSVDGVENFLVMCIRYQGPRAAPGDVAEQLDVSHHDVLELQGGDRRAGGSDLRICRLYIWNTILDFPSGIFIAIETIICHSRDFWRRVLQLQYFSGIAIAINGIILFQLQRKQVLIRRCQLFYGCNCNMIITFCFNCSIAIKMVAFAVIVAFNLKYLLSKPQTQS